MNNTEAAVCAAKYAGDYWASFNAEVKGGENILAFTTPSRRALYHIVAVSRQDDKPDRIHDVYVVAKTELSARVAAYEALRLDGGYDAWDWLIEYAKELPK